jgi:hypothetical protein
MPTIGELFKTSWATFKASLLNLFLLSLLSLFVQVIILVVFGIIVFAILITGGIVAGMAGLTAANASRIFGSVPMVAGLSATGIVYLLISIIVGAAFTGALVIVVARAEQKVGLGEAIKLGFGRALPIIIVNFVLCFLLIGTFVPFIFPVLIVQIFLFPVLYEVILEKKKTLEAIRFSMGMVKLHFGDIFVRGLVIIVINFLISSVLYFPQMMMNFGSGALGSRGAGLSLMASMWSWLVFIPNVLVSWYCLAYMINLYKQARAVTPVETKARTWWLWAMAIFGWVVLGLTIAVAGWGVAANWKEIEKKLNPPPKEKQAEMTYTPSSCGLSVPTPKSTDNKDGKDRKWLYEEITLDQDMFYVLDKDVFAPKVVLGAFLGYKQADLRLGGDDFSVGYPGLNIYCADNTKNLNLEEFKALAVAGKNNKVTFETNVVWGEVELVPVFVEGVDSNNKKFRDSAYLGITPDQSRLLYLRYWTTDDKDPFKTQIEKDGLQVIRNLKYRASAEKLSDMTFAPPEKTPTTTPAKTNTTPAAPSCLRYNIREGEFASNKCYSQSDYNDLTYYAGQYDSAVFTLNGIKNRMSVTCNGSDFFKAQCEQDKKDQVTWEEKVRAYKTALQAVIARGK